jgi:hypothetical protein
MRQIKVLCLALVLAAVACRGIPVAVRDAHNESQTSAMAATLVAQETLVKIEAKSAELNDVSVSAAFETWKTEYTSLLTARTVVLEYLQTKPSDSEVAQAYLTANQILRDLNGGFNQISMHWRLMIAEENAEQAARFVYLFRKDIERFNTLNRKFDEWIRQFPVKG